ncbi:MAG: 4-hydroxy-tetrahydrodipicolinate reductase [Planctomycetaceae bacterium]|nr:4-hydroxy-tetrahydrodipicolinate reductase [Planctomycetaceae bacterium]
MTDTARIAINGAGGRMGRRIVALAHADPALAVTAAIDAEASGLVGQDAGELAGIGTIDVAVSASLPENVDLVVDFSTPEGLVAIAEVCRERGIGLVAATTGLEPPQQAVIDAVAEVAPLIVAPNMSLAVNLTMKLAADAARALKSAPEGVDVEIVERHHRFKQDSPSGTALKFGELIAAELQQTRHVHGRQGRVGERPQDEIGYHALRTGDNVGEHTIVFGMIGETIDLTVRGQTRDSYAYGAIAAAKFLTGKDPGSYTMNDVLGL